MQRRSLLTALGALGAAAALPTAALPRSEVRAWDIFTDVLVVGSGAAGLCAALEARAAGASVMVIESLPRAGGCSAMSGGVIYAGGGTSLQKVLRIDDTSEAMYQFLLLSGGPMQQHDKLQRYCEESPAHFEWLLDQGIIYRDRFSERTDIPTDRESLYFSGNERSALMRDAVPPAPRGHVPAVKGRTGGRALVGALLGSARRAGVELRTGVEGRQLVTESDGAVAGAVVRQGERDMTVRARRGVVLAGGGFVHDRDMLARHAPVLASCSVPWGGAGETGAAIRMGLAAGAASRRLHEGYVITPLHPPQNVLAGLVVNATGQRFIAEDSYHGLLGHAIAYEQQGRAWLITDQRASFVEAQAYFPLAARANSIGNIADKLGFPVGALQNTVAFYNRHAANGGDPVYHKDPALVRPLQGPPYSAWDLSLDTAFAAAHTLGGLHTAVNGEVYNPWDEVIPGLFAAGRSTAGLPTAPYAAAGISLGDCTFFGRLAGRRAGQPR